MTINLNVKISVIIPVYNRATTILCALESVLTQTLRPHEIIVVDDCSTDGTVAVLNNITEPCVRIIRLERNGGAQNARIRGIEMARGDYLAFLDSDDEWFPDALENRLSSFLAAGFKDGLMYGDARFNGRTGDILAYRRLSGLQYEYLCKELSLCPFSVMMLSRSCFLAVGLPSADFPSWQDDDMVLTVGRRFPIHHCGAVVAIMHRSPNCISLNKRAVYEGCRRMVAKYAGDIIRFHGYGWLFLWKLRILSSYIAQRIDQQSHRIPGKRQIGLQLATLNISRRLLKGILGLFFERVNS